MLEVMDQTLMDYQNQRLLRFQRENLKIPKDSIIFVGDSIIEFFPLKKHLGHDLPLVNRGIAGADSQWLLDHLKEQVWELEPAKVFILIGTNDIGLGYDESIILANISQIIETIRSESIYTHIHLLSVLPVNESPDYAERVKIRRNITIQFLNIQLSQLPGIDFIDLYPILLDDTGQLAPAITTDGLHLNQRGYELISEVLKLYI
ncbi:SGNH/GDSL hydrolase family protein [Streptococcus sp. HF-1907]|uniref:SGNH/GDSL hydrolase family protein n=1 Tax=Streptococcus sp. HF-1907 TaxID=2785793 RepID=UPI001E563A37|nr:SGNH/GDSL hydrolase family protein [Streptococcus sp. HF-1907]